MREREIIEKGIASDWICLPLSIMILFLNFYYRKYNSNCSYMSFDVININNNINAN